MRDSEEEVWVRLTAATESCAAAFLFLEDLGPEGLTLVRHLLFCPGCRGLAPGRAEGPDARAQTIEGLLVAEGLMMALMAREPAGRLAFLDAEPSFLTGAFLSLIACAVSGSSTPEPVAEIALWACAELDRIRCDRRHPFNRGIRHGAVLDLFKHLDAGSLLPGLLAQAREAMPAGAPEAQPLLRLEEEAVLWNRQIEALSHRLAESLLPPLPWYHPFRAAGEELPATETGIVLGRLARAPGEWLVPLGHVLGCPSCRTQLGLAATGRRKGGAARKPPARAAGSRWEDAVLPALSQVGEALREELAGCADPRRERVLLWALEDLAHLLGNTVAPPLPLHGISPAGLEPELREVGKHVAECPVCQEEARGIAAPDYREAEELFAVLHSHPWSWEKAMAEDGRAWTPAFGRLLACERARAEGDYPRQSWLRDLEDRRLEALTAGPEPPAAAGALRGLLGVRRLLLEVELLIGQCRDLAARLPEMPVELYEAHRNLLRVERRVEWATAFLLEGAGSAVAWAEPPAAFESRVGWISRAPAEVRSRLAQVAPSARLRGGSWGLGVGDRLPPPDAAEWAKILADSADHRRALLALRPILERCAEAVTDPWQAELLGYLCRELQEVDRRVADIVRALALKGLTSRRLRRQRGRNA